MKRFALGLSILVFHTVAQAQWADQDGFVDYGMTHQVIVNGSIVPDSETQIIHGTARILAQTAKGRETCTGTVIAPQVILTAAHCFMSKPTQGKIKVAIADREYSVAGYVAHPDFVYLPPKTVDGVRLPAVTKNDIGLVFLSRNLSASSVPALLPPQGWTFPDTVDGIVAGYGVTSREAPKSLGTLRWVRTEVEEIGVANLMIYGSNTFCNGDSGGPTYVAKEGRYSVVGVSSTSNCQDRATVVRVSDYVDWIHQQIAKARSIRTI